MKFTFLSPCTLAAAYSCLFLAILEPVLCLSLQNVFGGQSIKLLLRFDADIAKESIPHYLSLDPVDDERLPPIDLFQYPPTEKVLRLDYSGLPATDEMLFKKQCYAMIAKYSLDVWAKSSLDKFFDIRVSDVEAFAEILEEYNLPDVPVSIIIPDLAQSVYETFPQASVNTTETVGETAVLMDYLSRTGPELTTDMAKEELNIMTDLFFKQYRNLDMVYLWFEMLRATYPDILKHERIGKTYEGREMSALHLSVAHKDNHKDDGTRAPDTDFDHEDDPTERRTIVITGGLHAREWISTSTVCYSLFRLLRSYDHITDSVDGHKHRKLRKILTSLDFIFIPVFNPDGYYHTWSVDRLWRKNRQETFNPRCFGLDIDHSFDFRWQHSDAFNPCGENYSGEDSFEAIEAQQWNNFLTNHTNQILGYLDLHSYSQQILYPYAWSCEQQPRDSENLIELAYGMSKAIRLSSGRYYNVLPACVDRDVDIEPSLGSGTSLDYMYHNKAYWAFQIKLRDSGDHGFLLPPKHIIPVGKEIYQAIKYFCFFILESKEY
ncbi:hypothetical protein BABINDRAFT_159688 [Babjeviella inositovora NRRL Y-12698]|uniref:Inactive metallocarboxypeptidase ECM14 n=1 Tax=Babjeviella inositovora NRRL Y-12698 TaxID=984486 RepID=A0A1E3R033_9ASCO|nr:uncharacterized protein BABINDRAFT_159688 [Babjeviella inositovora NRRL Y-12698]ODQ83253.1 hypothetical protein BABINDRAFT_159688 [Babjeviella inositovora NRRL Y-12698]